MLDFQSPHRRFNPLTGEWILVSPHRAKRPWQGTIEANQNPDLPVYAQECHLCPGNTRSNGQINPKYTDTFVFVNDHSALLSDVTDGSLDEHGLIVAQQEAGICKVICYTPQHNKTMANMTTDEITSVINAWKTEYESVGSDSRIGYIQIFENKGPLMGASSPHPHGQIWANRHLPSNILKEDTNQKRHFASNNEPLLLTYYHLEKQHEERIIAEFGSMVVAVPFWATWPYETIIMPTRPIQSLRQCSQQDILDLSMALADLTQRYDRIFNTSFPYSMGIHQAPTDGQDHPEWQFHMHFYPPLLRSATIKKYFVGYEMMAEGQRDINPEDAAKTLRTV